MDEYAVIERFGFDADVVFEGMFWECQDYIFDKVEQYIREEAEESEEPLTYKEIEEMEELFLNDFMIKEVNEL